MKLTNEEKDKVVKRALRTIAMVFTEQKVRPSRELWSIAISIYQAAVGDFKEVMENGTE